MSTKRVKLVVAYDGTDFCGWAAQTGQRTVQGTLKEAVRQVSGEDVEITGASRTDSGAHARGQVAHFDTGVPIEPEKWARVLNKVMSHDVRVLSSREVPSSFHSRFSARDRWYCYRITTIQDPFRLRFAHHHWAKLDIEWMSAAATMLVGEHDFRAFTEELDPGIENTTRALYSVEVRQIQDGVRIDVIGSAFMRGMMRRMAGALLEIGRSRRPAADIERLLNIHERDSVHWPEVLPARGLTLMRVRYGRHPRDNRK